MTDSEIKTLLVLLARYDAHDCVFWNTHLKFLANTSDFFFWGTADAEEITGEDLADLEQAFEDVKAVSIYEFYGVLLWAARKIKMRPQRPQWINLEPPLQALFLAAGPEREPGSEG